MSGHVTTVVLDGGKNTMKKRTKSNIVTTDGMFRSALRRLWMTSPERSAAVKRDKYTCQLCGKKKSVAKGKECKIEVDHKYEINWDEIIATLRRILFCRHYDLKVLCRECHRRKTQEQRWPKKSSPKGSEEK